MRRYWLWKVVVENIYAGEEDEFYIIAKDLTSAAKKAIKVCKETTWHSFISEDDLRVVSVRLLGEVWI